jgi:hypothetical protein
MKLTVGYDGSKQPMPRLLKKMDSIQRDAITEGSFQWNGAALQHKGSVSS